MSDGDDELGGGLDTADVFDDLVNGLGNDEAEEVKPEEVKPTELTPPPEAQAEAATKPKRSRKTAEPKPTVLAEPVDEQLDPVMDYESLPESTRLEMAAGRAALLAKVAR